MNDKQATQTPSSRELNLFSLEQPYIITKGSVDIFLVPTKGNERGKRYPLGHWQAGELLLGLKGSNANTNWQLLASCAIDIELNLIDWQEISAQTLHQWQQHFINYLHQHNDSYSTSLILEEKKNKHQAVLNFYNSIHKSLIKTADLTRQNEKYRTSQRKKIENSLLKRAYMQMLSTLHPYNIIGKTGRKNTLTFCVQHVAQFYQHPISEYLTLHTIDDIAQKTGMQTRQVQLSGKWWRSIIQPVLLQKPDEEGFFLALPRVTYGLILINPLDGIRKKLTAKEAQLFSLTAWQVYCPLPQKALKIRDLIPFSFRGCKRDILRLLVVGSLAAILSLVSPWFTGILFEQVVPAGDFSQLKQIVWALLVAAISASMFELVRAVTVLRIGSKLNLNLEIAIWDRLIRLPATFFRQFTSGDLAKRAMAASSVRHIMAGVVISSLLSGIFSIFSLALLFYYDRGLALTATGITFLICVYTLFISRRQLSYYKTVTEISGELSGMVIQLLGGIAKIQTTGREKTAFSLWAIKNSQIKNETYKANWYNALLSSLNAFSLPLLFVIIFAQFINRADPLSLGVFLAFNAALGQFTAGMLGMTDAVSTVINSIPMLKRLTPIIENTPEIHAGKYDPGVLKGKIEVDCLRFSYSKGQTVVKDVSFTIEPGQYVAVTGPSGSGKSTLLRLLLGFEKANQGNIFFDDHDIKQLNIQRVREQCGVVLQNSFLISGTLFDNIVGTALLTQEDAWLAAEKAGLADDIKKMPMGMHTVISERGGTLSGGQRQRVLIARALAKNPKILFFDEATSALDNLTQSIVIESLEQLKVTRLVIAHRLTTIEKADLIVVMNQGEIIQSGSFSELMQQEGLFQIMARRQLAT
ncbi:NHLP bacteriocin export ABC transporter permease/ATPase subunit [Legionella hackeliae]|uniref:Putative Xenobiotic-transporting ATPase n=1 Tax=Legionella hackeliae TaxID=449 RepID=A0A0A8UPI5_LEGHA|nr:NHLP bacteriocin export ABC transporter permease/ATPase subunit [Legionella hackeliae]KTD06668.1 ABC transporter [Legionella hackeliae]CEK10790.1 putative Xenobiotic-transporting ATPase [Legionella hackeliae]STX47527.1 ABC transporter [Legionella hackeliae]